jgi:bifunctional non-homologous end joining protein LigD
MLATPDAGEIDRVLLTRDRWVYEPKYDGMRVLVSVEPGTPSPRVALWSRLGHEKTAQFPDALKGLREFARALRGPVLLDGELVALDARGEPASFTRLSGRLHVLGQRDIATRAAATPVALIVFDILRDGADDLRPLPLVDRKARLERVFGTNASSVVRLGEMAAGDGRRLLARARAQGWEGLLAKDAQSRYESGRRSPAWRKLKLPRRQEFVVGGWTDPKGLRQTLGSIAVGYYDASDTPRALRFAGLVGSGFSGEMLETLATTLRAAGRSTSPFTSPPALPKGVHFVEPRLVVDVKFTEWTPDDVLRHPVFVGIRDDIDPEAVVREPVPVGEVPAVPPAAGSPTRGAHAVRATRRGRTKAAGSGETGPLDAAHQLVLSQMRALEDARRDGTLVLPDGARLPVTNLAKVFWPAGGITKGELMRHYVRVSPWLLPVLADRPLVMKRYPNGVTGKAFYQHRAPDDVPSGVRVERVEGDEEAVPRIIGGALVSLLYMTQLASLSQDPWFSRVSSPDEADYIALDLDPMPGVPFRQVLEVARVARDVLGTLGIPAGFKTSGSSGLHVYVPLAKGIPYESAKLFCEILATLVASQVPRLATIERVVSKRGLTVYVDYLQNLAGKTLASVYSARASGFGGVSTPLTPAELDEDLHPEDFTIRTVQGRFARTGDIWATVRRVAPVDLRAVLERLARTR